MSEIHMDVWRAIYGDAFLRGEAFSNLGYLCDTIGNRFAGTPGDTAARAFVAGKFEDYGLKVHEEELPFLAWQRGRAEGGIIAPVSHAFQTISLGYSAATSPEGLIGEPLFLNYGHPRDFEASGEQIRGKIAFVMEGSAPGDRFVHRSEKTGLAIERGAVGYLNMSNIPGGLPLTGTCRFGQASPIPCAGITRENGEFLKRLLSSSSEVRVRLVLENTFRETTSANVIAELPGTDRADEIVLVGGHLDAWDIAQGAMDNGTGAVVVMEAARLLQAHRDRLRRTVRFVAFGLEEIGLAGSSAYVERHRRDLDRIVAMLNLDIVGVPVRFNVEGFDSLIPLAESFRSRLPELELEPTTDNVSLHSDHLPFALEGVPCLTLACHHPKTGGLATYHNYIDTLDKVSRKSLCEASALVAGVLFELAICDQPPAPHKSPDEVKETLRKHDCVDALKAEGRWRFE